MTNAERNARIESRRNARSPRYAAKARSNAKWNALITAAEGDESARYFFTRGACEAFNSYPVDTPREVEGDPSGNVFFITSEKFEDDPRMYTVRRYTPGAGVQTMSDDTATHRHATPEAAANAMTDAMIAHRNNLKEAGKL